MKQFILFKLVLLIFLFFSASNADVSIKVKYARKASWQLVGSKDSLDILSSIGTINSGNNIYSTVDTVWAYDTSKAEWSVASNIFTPSKYGYKQLDTTSPYEAFWVSVKAYVRNISFKTISSSDEFSFNLSSGWNLRALSEYVDVTDGAYLNKYPFLKDKTNDILLYAYNPSANTFDAYSPNGLDSSFNGKKFSNINANEGFWIRSKIDKTYRLLDVNVSPNIFVDAVSFLGLSEKDLANLSNRNKVLTDNILSIEWERKIEVASVAISAKYANAEYYCAVLNYAGKTDWRLPIMDELKTLALYDTSKRGEDYNSTGLHRDTLFFNDFNDSSQYWSSDRASNNRHKTLNPISGINKNILDSTKVGVRTICVRNNN